MNKSSGVRWAVAVLALASPAAVAAGTIAGYVRDHNWYARYAGNPYGVGYYEIAVNANTANAPGVGGAAATDVYGRFQMTGVAAGPCTVASWDVWWRSAFAFNVPVPTSGSAPPVDLRLHATMWGYPAFWDDAGYYEFGQTFVATVTGVTSQHSISRCAARKVWFSRDSRRLAALSDDWHLAVWDLVRRHVLFVFQTPNGELADSAGGCFDADGDRFAFATGREACLEGTGAPRVARLGERLLGSTANRLGRALMGVGFQPGGHAVGVGHRGDHGPGGRHRRGETAVGRTRSPGRRMMT